MFLQGPQTQSPVSLSIQLLPTCPRIVVLRTSDRWHTVPFRSPIVHRTSRIQLFHLRSRSPHLTPQIESARTFPCSSQWFAHLLSSSMQGQCLPVVHNFTLFHTCVQQLFVRHKSFLLHLQLTTHFVSARCSPYFHSLSPLVISISVKSISSIFLYVYSFRQL